MCSQKKLVSPQHSIKYPFSKVLHWCKASLSITVSSTYGLISPNL